MVSEGLEGFRGLGFWNVVSCFGYYVGGLGV